MHGDFCYACDGTGDRDWLSGAPCYDCGGSGWIEDVDYYGSCDRCGCDIGPDDIAMLCDQCRWMVEKSQ